MLTSSGERKANEDFLDVLISSDRQDFILSDGLGGHGNGDVASRFVTETIKEALEKEMSVEESIMEAQEKLLEKQKAEHAENSMKTTGTCLELSGNKARFAHVGASRIYHFE